MGRWDDGTWDEIAEKTAFETDLRHGNISSNTGKYAFLGGKTCFTFFNGDWAVC